MGEVVRRDAAAADIVADVRTSYVKAVAKQGKWQALAEEMLAPTLKVADTVTQQLGDARTIALPFVAALDAANDKADKVVAKVGDDVWNKVGRPRYDAALEIIFPGGSAFYTEGDVAEQPDRMELLVEILKAGVHPKLPAGDAADFAAEVQAEADALRLAVQNAIGPRTKVALLERVFLAVARSAGMQLAAFKRTLKGAGFSEAEIHTVIPDRPKASSKKAGPPPSPPAPPAPATP